MMSSNNVILMPKLGLTMTEGLVASWNVKAGDSVAQGDVMFVVETDKIATDVPADEDLVIDTILIAEGSTAEVGAILATLRRPGAEQRADGDSPELSAPPAPSPKVIASPNTPQPVAAPKNARLLATPLARRIARKDGIDLNRISGSGPRGRIKAIDLVAVSAERTPVAPVIPVVPAGPVPQGSSRKPTSIERTIAERLTFAKSSIPHFYVMADADVTELLALRSSLNADGQFSKVTVNHLIILAMTRALTMMPEFNIIWTDDSIVSLDMVDVGVAVETPRGLLAPVIKDLGGQSLAELVRRTNEIIDLARGGQLAAGMMSGGALTLSNVGMFGATYLVPIVNPGQSAILGAGGNKPIFRPDANGAPVLRQEIGLTLSCDHRVHDGARAARFLNLIVSLIEAPLTMLRG